MDEPILRAEGLRRRYGPRVVVDVGALAVSRGEVLAILGPNGAGKSTLFRLLLLLERPDAGRIWIDDREVRAGDRAARRRMAGVFQRPFLFSGSVASNVGYGLRLRGITAAERERRVAEALGWVGLAGLAEAPVRTLSGGEAQRAALARALVLEPELVLLDEPTSSLDVTQRRRFQRDVERLVRERSQAAVLVTHDPAEAFALADRIAVLEAGRVVQVGTPDELVMEPATPFVAAFTGAELLLDGAVAAREDRLVRVALEGEARLWATDATGDAGAAGDPVHVAYRPEDVTLSAARTAGESSARNRFRLVVGSVVPAGALVRVRLEGRPPLTALLTRQSAEALELRPGREVVAQLKATALRVFPAARRP